MNKLNRKDFCCDEIYSHLIGDEHGCEIHFEYFPDTRDYAIPYKKKFGSGSQAVLYCPWCGSKLPSSLNNKMIDVLKNEYSIEKYEDLRLPSEFKTDEWWKKRGL
jgi:hypothetical protein